MSDQEDVSIPSWAVRGAKVMCIDGDFDDPRNGFKGPIRLPQQGVEYTIREVRVRFVPEWMEVMVGLLLEEVVNPIAAGGSAAGEEVCWSIRAFAPIVPMRMKAEQEREAPLDPLALEDAH